MSIPIDPALLDPSVPPTDDFFTHINKKWKDQNPIPLEETRWSSFVELRVNVEKQLREIFDGLVAGQAPAKGTIDQKVRDFYLTAMDEEKANNLGLAPLKEIFGKIDGLSSPESIIDATAFLHHKGADVLWMCNVQPDEKNTALDALYLYQSGIGLPDRDYYLNEDEKSRSIREKYLAYMKEIFSLAGFSAADADAVMALETALAKASMTRVELRDVERTYNKVTLEELAALAPKVDWQRYFAALGMPVPVYVIVGQPDFIKETDRLIASLPIEAVKAYFRWQAVNGFAPFLGDTFEKAKFGFYNGVFGGAKEMKVRWRRALAATNIALEYAVGELYVRHHFSEEARRKINALVDHLTSAYRARIAKLEWMGEETKRKAYEKLDAFSRKLGYPDVWRDYTALEIGTDSYALNYMRAYSFEFDRQMRKVGQPVDRNEWYMSPQTVNACYAPSLNEILFPAAILQPPFFDPDADDAVNYGGIGSVIGHEITHGFDDQGSLYDPQGNIRNWWTDDDRKLFKERTKKLVTQFNAYEPLPGLRVNGELTLGENIADLGGLLVAYDAMKLVFAEGGTPAPIDGLSAEQRFFIGYAITERGHAREEIVRLLVQTDPHSPSEFRVNGPVSDMDEFYEAFGVKQGDKLWRPPEERVKIW